MNVVFSRDFVRAVLDTFVVDNAPVETYRLSIDGADDILWEVGSYIVWQIV